MNKYKYHSPKEISPIILIFLNFFLFPYTYITLSYSSIFNALINSLSVKLFSIPYNLDYLS